MNIYSPYIGVFIFDTTTFRQSLSFAPLKFNMEPENDGFQKESTFPVTSFQVPC